MTSADVVAALYAPCDAAKMENDVSAEKETSGAVGAMDDYDDMAVTLGG